LEAEEYAVYDAVIERSHAKYAQVGSNLIVISDQTATSTVPNRSLNETLQFFQGKALLGEIPREMTEGFLERNKDPQPLKDLFQISTRHLLLSSAPLTEIFESGEWDDFYRLYPKSQGIVELSAVGFDRSYASGAGVSWKSV
jgi:hypothetical protein